MKTIAYQVLFFLFVINNIVYTQNSDLRINLVKQDKEILGLTSLKNVYTCEIERIAYGKSEPSRAIMIGMIPHFFIIQDGININLGRYIKKDENLSVSNIEKIKPIGDVDFNNNTTNLFATNDFIVKDEKSLFLSSVGLYLLDNKENPIEKDINGIIHSFERIGNTKATFSCEYHGKPEVFTSNFTICTGNGDYFLDISRFYPTVKNLAIIDIEHLITDYTEKRLKKQYAISSLQKNNTEYKFKAKGIKVINENVVSGGISNYKKKSILTVLSCIEGNDFRITNNLGNICCLFDINNFELKKVFSLPSKAILIPSKYNGYFLLSMYGQIYRYDSNGELKWEKRFSNLSGEAAYNLTESNIMGKIYIVGTSTHSPYSGYNNPVIWEIDDETQECKKITFKKKGYVCISAIVNGLDIYCQMYKKEKGIEPNFNDSYFNQLMIND